VLASRRCGKGSRFPVFAGEFLSVVLAPPVLLAALVYGGVKYRKFLLV
jgi:hypothetical protein